jgi:hypothetical protein
MRARVLRGVSGRATGKEGGAGVPDVPRGATARAGRAVGPGISNVEADLGHDKFQKGKTDEEFQNVKKVERIRRMLCDSSTLLAGKCSRAFSN